MTPRCLFPMGLAVGATARQMVLFGFSIGVFAVFMLIHLRLNKVYMYLCMCACSSVRDITSPCWSLFIPSQCLRCDLINQNEGSRRRIKTFYNRSSHDALLRINIPWTTNGSGNTNISSLITTFQTRRCKNKKCGEELPPWGKESL